MELKELLLRYKEITEKFIEAIKNDEEADKFLVERTEIIEEMNGMDIKKEELKKVVEEINLLTVEKEAFNTLNEERSKIKDEIFQLKKSKRAVFAYENKFNGINFINKEI
ncbi:MAG: hypothetical protein E7215_06500 [Clostridium sulfidigenes]|uniref:Flagellar protein FliT n=1 Tax=Clostridium sulfidigenes TaxID=318464 RepID=A0A927W9U9_9CLOT|nr:hypothetical protein [Clostridium sulfidigenes]